MISSLAPYAVCCAVAHPDQSVHLVRTKILHIFGAHRTSTSTYIHTWCTPHILHSCLLVSTRACGRFVTMRLFKFEWFVPKVVVVDGHKVIQWRWWDQYLIFGNGRSWDGFLQGSIDTLTGLMGKVFPIEQREIRWADLSHCLVLAAAVCAHRSCHRPGYCSRRRGILVVVLQSEQWLRQGSLMRHRARRWVGGGSKMQWMARTHSASLGIVCVSCLATVHTSQLHKSGQCFNRLVRCTSLAHRTLLAPSPHA